MNKTTKGFIVVLGSLALLGGAFYLFMDKKRFYANIIVKSGNSGNFPVLLTFGEDYLKQWAKASKKKTETFTFEGAEYRTKGGTKIA